MKLLFCLFILIAPHSSSSQEKIKEQIIEDLLIEIGTYKNISIDFNLHYENTRLDVKTNKKGKLKIEKDKFNLELDDQIIINNGEFQWTYLKDLNEVQITNNEIDVGLSNFSDLLKISKNDYKISLLEDQLNFQLFELIPKKINSFIKIQIKVEKYNRTISEIKVFDKDGGNFIYSINKFKYDQKINSFYFDSSKFPGIEIIDLR
jgi:outer membrane lipoprotein-sorting protein